MKTLKFYLLSSFALLLVACVDNNNRDNKSGGKQQESDYVEDAPTYNKAEEEINDSQDTATTDKRVPKDPTEIKSKRKRIF